MLGLRRIPGVVHLLMLMSWIVAIDPAFHSRRGRTGRARHLCQELHRAEPGVCIVRSGAGLSDHQLLRTNRTWPALVLGAIALGFAVNMAFVIVSRTAMVTIPIMLAVFALLH
jgi:hypothetical protein